MSVASSGLFLLFSSVTALRAPASHACGAGLNGLDDIVVSGAAAEIAVELGADGRFVEPLAPAPNDVERRHDHARSAESALQAVVGAERLLHRVELTVAGEAL